MDAGQATGAGAGAGAGGETMVEPRPPVHFLVTGFGKFPGVPANPTEVLVSCCRTLLLLFFFLFLKCLLGLKSCLLLVAR